MATLRQISYDLLQHIRANFSDDDDLDIRNIHFWVRNQRLLWIKNSANKQFSRKFYQTLGNLRLKQIPIEDNQILKIPLHRVEEAIPVPVFIGERPIMKVSPIDPRMPDYTVVSAKDGFNVGYGRFNNTCKYSFLDELYRINVTGLDNNMYIPLLKLIHVEIIAEDPMTVKNFTLDSTYPIDDALIPYMLDLVTKSHIEQFRRTNVDNINNAKNDLN